MTGNRIAKSKRKSEKKKSHPNRASPNRKGKSPMLSIPADSIPGKMMADVKNYVRDKKNSLERIDRKKLFLLNFPYLIFATVYKGNIIKNLIMDCQSYTKYRPNETTGGIFVSWRRKEELPTGA